MKKYVVIVAGGSGKRMASDTPKQFMKISGKPVLGYTMEKFYHFDKKMGIILVLPEDFIDYWKEICRESSLEIPHFIQKGGETRFHSVKNGLEPVEDNSLVAIHDGVRPLVSQQTIERCYDTAKEKNTAVPVVPVHASLRKLKSKGSYPVDRSDYFIVQTPQVFSSSALKKAYQQEYHPLFTDDASVAEAYGMEIHLVEGNPENIKITTPSDFIIARSLVEEKSF